MLPFVKMHGLGNDFVVVDCINAQYDIEKLVAQAVAICDRRFGVGADGLILILPGKISPFRMRIINSDGSEPEMCGNGIRCFAKYLYEHELTTELTFTVETLAGDIIPQLTLKDGKVSSVCVDMGEPRLERAEIPMTGSPGRVINEPVTAGDRTFELTAVSMGNPHAVAFVNDVRNFPLEKYGAFLETEARFPRKTNVEFVQVISPDYLLMRVWERGAGVTLACGTGACATLVAAVLTGKAERRATVELPGGPLQIFWNETDNRVYMTGPATEVFRGKIKLA